MYFKHSSKDQLSKVSFTILIEKTFCSFLLFIKKTRESQFLSNQYSSNIALSTEKYKGFFAQNWKLRNSFRWIAPSSFFVKSETLVFPKGNFIAELWTSLSVLKRNFFKHIATLPTRRGGYIENPITTVKPPH